MQQVLWERPVGWFSLTFISFSLSGWFVNDTLKNEYEHFSVFLKEMEAYTPKIKNEIVLDPNLFIFRKHFSKFNKRSHIVTKWPPFLQMVISGLSKAKPSRQKSANWWIGLRVQYSSVGTPKEGRHLWIMAAIGQCFPTNKLDHFLNTGLNIATISSNIWELDINCRLTNHKSFKKGSSRITIEISTMYSKETSGLLEVNKVSINNHLLDLFISKFNISGTHCLPAMSWNQ